MALSLAQLRAVFSKLRKIGKKASPYRKTRLATIKSGRKSGVSFGGKWTRAFSNPDIRKAASRAAFRKKRRHAVGLGLLGGGAYALSRRRKKKRLY